MGFCGRHQCEAAALHSRPAALTTVLGPRRSIRFYPEITHDANAGATAGHSAPLFTRRTAA